MLGLKIDSNELKQYAILALAYLLLSLIIFWPVTLRIASTVPGTGGDVFQSIWELWWVPYSLFTLHSSPYITHYIFYPIGANLATQTLAPIAGIVSAIFQVVNLAFAYNAIFIIGFVLSGLFAYLLAYHVTKHKMASFIAGFIYAFSPIHIVQAFGHVQFTNIEFIPLFLLFFLKMAEDKKPIYAVCAALSFVLLTFMGDIEQGLMSIILAFFVLVYMLIDKHHRNNILEKNFIVSFAVMIATILIVSAPITLQLLSSLNANTLSSVNSQANVSYNVLYSPDLFSFLVPSSFNGVLSFASSHFAAFDAPAVAERTTYIGYTVILLALAGLYYEYKEKFRKTGMLLLPLVVFGLLSIGPYLQFGGTVTPIPGLYQIYHQIPYFNVLREPGRFDIPFELLLGIFAALGIIKLENMIANSSMKKFVPIVIIALLLIEYNAWPTSSSMLNGMYTLNTTIPKAYQEIGLLNSNFSVLVLPALPNYTNSKPALYPGLALYYQTAFKRPLVGGYTTRVNATQTFSLINVPLITSAYYLQTGQGLVYGSPIKENYSNVTNFFLGAYNVGFIAIIRQAYNQTDLASITSYLSNIFGYPVYQSNDTIVFTTSKITQTAGTSRVEYTPVLVQSPLSLWQLGWTICGSSPCSKEYLNTWFAINPAYINIYSLNYSKVNMSMQALAPFGAKQENIIFNGKPLTTLNLAPNLKNFSITLGVVPGINQLIFVSTNSTQGTYSNIGIANITFKRYS